MGNVAQSPLAGAASVNDDAEWINLTTGLMFNQGYLFSSYRKLPKFDGTVIDASSKKAAAPPDDDGTVSKQARGMDRQVMNLFAKEDDGGGGLLSVQRLPHLAAFDQPFEVEQYTKLAKMQLRLLLRVHLSYVRQQRERRGAAAGSVASLCLPPWAPSAESLVRHAAADEASAASSLAVGMCLAVAKGVGTANSAVFSALAVTVVDLLRAAGPLSLAPRRGAGGMLAHTLAAIVEFAEEVAKGATGEAKGAALGLMLAVALSRGSVHDVLLVVGELTRSDAGAGLPASVLGMLADLRKPRPDLHILSVPLPWVREWSGRGVSLVYHYAQNSPRLCHSSGRPSTS